MAKACAAWLVGRFVSQVPQGFRAEIYACLVPLLSPSLGDLVISLTALGALHALVDDLGAPLASPGRTESSISRSWQVGTC